MAIRESSGTGGNSGGDSGGSGGVSGGGDSGGRAGENSGGQRAGKSGLNGESRVQIAVTWVSGLLLLAAAGYLAWEGTAIPAPAEFEAELGLVREADGHYYLPVLVRNLGDESVRTLSISVELLGEDAAAADSATVTLDWLPEGSSRSVVLILDRDPAQYRPAVRFSGYQLP